MKKIFEQTFKEHFGNKITIYDSLTNYFCIIKERNGDSYFLISYDCEYWYPINSLLKAKDGNLANILSEVTQINTKNLGKSTLPKFMKDIINKLNI